MQYADHQHKIQLYAACVKLIAYSLLSGKGGVNMLRDRDLSAAGTKNRPFVKINDLELYYITVYGGY